MNEEEFPNVPKIPQVPPNEVIKGYVPPPPPPPPPPADDESTGESSDSGESTDPSDE